jgi:hypothetical protein
LAAKGHRVAAGRRRVVSREIRRTKDLADEPYSILKGEVDQLPPAADLG